MRSVSELEEVLPAAVAAITAVTDHPLIVNLKPPILSILSCRILYSSIKRFLKSASSNVSADGAAGELTER